MKTLVFFIFFLSIVSCEGKSDKEIILIKKNPNISLDTIGEKSKELKCGDITFYNATKNLWKNFKIGNHNFKEINSDNHLYFVEDCSSISVSPDKRVYLFREVLNDQIQKDYDYYEAPYDGYDIKTQGVASYVSVLDNKIRYLSLSSSKGDFVNSHDLIFEENIYNLTDDFLKNMPLLIKQNKLTVDLEEIKIYLNNEPLAANNLNNYNDIAFYLGEKNKIKESIYLLNIIISQFPDRAVAYLNIADAYWQTNNKEEGKKSYNQYISLMKSQNKDLSKIPQRVYERSK